jgi:ribosomal protein S18 acetylase RimI-like enzyme
MDFPHSPVILRECRPGDVDRLLEIDRICFPPDQAYSRAEMLFYLKRRSSIGLAAERDGEILGFAIGHVAGGSISRVITLDVIPEARRWKIGTGLMEALHGEFRSRGASRAVLEVDTANTGAQRFYHTFGYKRIELLPGYYKGHADAYRMSLDL